MVNKSDIDEIETELQQLRTLLMTSRERVRPQPSKGLKGERERAKGIDVHFSRYFRKEKEFFA